MNVKDAVLLPSLLALVLALSGCSDPHVAPGSAPGVVRNVPLVTAQLRNTPDLLEASGTVRAAQTSSLASQIMGTIVEIRVHEGDRVERGQVLVVIDEAQPQAALNRAVAAENAAQHEIKAAESELGLAESTFSRYQILYDKKVVSPLEFEGIKSREQSAVARRDLARAEFEQARAELTQARTTLEYARVRAPYDGVVTERKLDPGALASPGLPILTIEQLGHYRLEASINESELRYIHMGDEVPVTIDALGSSERKGRVAQIVPSADPASRSFLIKLDLPSNPQLRSGEFGTAEFTRGERAALMIPQTAVIQRGQLQGAYVIDGGKIANLRYITLGKTTGEQVEVLAGVESGEAVVANPAGLELSGKQIESQQ